MQDSGPHHIQTQNTITYLPNRTRSRGEHQTFSSQNAKINFSIASSKIVDKKKLPSPFKTTLLHPHPLRIEDNPRLLRPSGRKKINSEKDRIKITKELAKRFSNSQDDIEDIMREIWAPLPGEQKKEQTGSSLQDSRKAIQEDSSLHSSNGANKEEDKRLNLNMRSLMRSGSNVSGYPQLILMEASMQRDTDQDNSNVHSFNPEKRKRTVRIVGLAKGSSGSQLSSNPSVNSNNKSSGKDGKFLSNFVFLDVDTSD